MAKLAAITTTANAPTTMATIFNADITIPLYPKMEAQSNTLNGAYDGDTSVKQTANGAARIRIRSGVDNVAPCGYIVSGALRQIKC